jgi:hypothetical protein
MYISKVSVEKSAGGEMRWRATASDTSPDLYQERMSNELYDDFVRRIETKSPVPEPFDKVLGEDWNGGMPYLSISHYKSGREGKNVPGMPTKIYRDGNSLKGVGVLHNNELGHAVFNSLCDDLYTEKAKKDGKIRISIGFLDLEHKHMVGKGKTPDYTFERKSLTDECPMCQEGIGNKVYTKGQLVHLALTRVPVNPRTDMEVAKAMTIETKKQDAESIIGELSDTLEEKSMTSDVLVTKSEEVVEVVEEKSEVPAVVESPVVEEAQVQPEPSPEPVQKAKIAPDKKDEELTYDEADEEKREQRRNRPAGERSLLQKSFDNIESKVMEMKSQGVPAETALREIQPMYNALGELIKKSLQPEPTVAEAQNEISELTNIVKSLAETVSTLQQTMSTEIATLKAQTQGNASVRQLAQGVPMPRSLSGANLPEQKAEVPPLPGVPASLRSLAYRSTFVR